MMEETITFSPDQDGAAIKAAFHRGGKFIFSFGKEITDAAPESLIKAKLMLARAIIVEAGGLPL